MDRGYIYVNKENYLNNIDYLNSLSDKELCLVVKANGYGHGVEWTVNTAIEAGVKWFAVATINEAIIVRKLSDSIRILLLTEPSLSEVENQMIDTLSKGFRQRTCLAQALLHDPPVLILDEPTDGLDPNQKHEVRSLIKDMSEERTILISTHILEEVDAVCTSAMIIANGRVVGYGTPDELLSQSLYRNSVTVSLKNEDPRKLLDDFNQLDFVYSVEHVQDDREDLVTMRLYPKNKESISRKLEEYLFNKNVQLEQFTVERGRLDEVFRQLTTED